MKKSFVVLIIVGIVIVMGIVFFVSRYAYFEDSSLGYEGGDVDRREGEVYEEGDVDRREEDFDSPLETEVPTGLSMPFNVEDVDSLMGEVNPLGIVRFDKDQSDIGHPGIDIPLKQGSPVYAVADGSVVLIGSASDPWEGEVLFQLLQPTGAGSGWAFLYEHIEIANGVTLGTELERGDLVGTKIAPDGFTLHLQLSRVFNDYKYTSDAQCWPDFLSSTEKSIMDSWWNEYRQTQHLINSWDTNLEESKYPFKGLLDESKYPGGPQLCYSLGTDVR